MLGMARAPKPTTFRVDLFIPGTGLYTPYTSKEGTGLAMCQSLASGLTRQGAGCRIVELPSGTVIEEWKPTEEYIAKLVAKGITTAS
jgi:hypothetical protein